MLAAFHLEGTLHYGEGIGDAPIAGGVDPDAFHSEGFEDVEDVLRRQENGDDAGQVFDAACDAAKVQVVRRKRVSKGDGTPSAVKLVRKATVDDEDV